MKTKKMLVAALIASVSFFSCSQEGNINEDLMVNGVDIAALSSIDTAIVAEEYMPVGVMPDWAKEKMGEEEYRLWEIVGNHYQVDYSFLNSAYYQNNKNYFLSRLTNVAVSIMNGENEYYGRNFTIKTPLVYGTKSVELLSRPEINNPGHNLNYTLFTADGASLILAVVYVHIEESVEYILRSHEFYCTPAEASCSGASDCRITPTGEIHINYSGHMFYNGKTYKVDVNTGFLL